MPTQKRHYQSYVQLFVPTKDKHGNTLPKVLVESWKKRAEQIFRDHVSGYYISPIYRIEGSYRSDNGTWIDEPNYIIKAFGQAEDCRQLVKALENGFIEAMGLALEQESIGVESSIEGLALYVIK